MPVKTQITQELPSAAQAHHVTVLRARLYLGAEATTPSPLNIVRPAVPSVSASASASASYPTRNAPEHENAELIEYVKKLVKLDEDFYSLRFESLQRTNIVALEVKLLRSKANIQMAGDISDQDLKVLRETLEQYIGWNLSITLIQSGINDITGTALQNYMFVHSKETLKKADSDKKRYRLMSHFHSIENSSVFSSHYCYTKESHTGIDAMRLFFMRRLPVWLTWSQDERQARQTEYKSAKPPRKVSTFVNRLTRFVIAAVGGLFLIGPMLVMSFDSSRNKSLITVSVSIMLFISVLSLWMKASNVEALISAATYAAVLVVFVGTSTDVGRL